MRAGIIGITRAHQICRQTSVVHGFKRPFLHVARAVYYSAYFAKHVALPVDFPLLGDASAIVDPQNGPALVAAVQRIKSSADINASAVRDWCGVCNHARLISAYIFDARRYGAFREFCHKPVAGVHWCRNTMVNASDSALGWPTQKSFDGFLSLFILEHQVGVDTSQRRRRRRRTRRRTTTRRRRINQQC